jgi:hypothetical protein
MAIRAERNEASGRFQRRQARDTASLYEDAAAVARIWASRQPRPVDAARIPQRRWDETKRSLPEYAHLPNANEICRQLGGRGKPLPWRHVLDVAFDETRANEAVHIGVAAKRLDFPVSDERVSFSMNRVAQELGQDWLTNADYLYGYARLVERDRRRKNGGHLEAQLLTYSQIRGYVEQDWERACRIAEIRTAGEVDLPVHRGISMIDALVLVYHDLGGFLSEKQLRKYAVAHQFALANRPRDRGWQAIAADSRQRILDETGIDPGQYDPKRQPVWQPPDEPAAHDLPERRRRKIPKPEVLIHVIRFVEERGRGSRPTQPEWRVFQKRTGAPGLRTLNLHGGLPALVKEASRKGARERAERELHALLHPTPEQQSKRRLEEAQSRAEKPRAQQLLATIEQLGGATAGELTTHLGWAKDTVQVWLRPLKQTGRLKSVRVASGDKRGMVDRYVLADAPASAPLENDPEAVRKATAKAGRRAYDALVRLGGAADAIQIAAELGIQRVPTTKLLTELIKTGFVTIEVSAHPGGRGRRVIYMTPGSRSRSRSRRSPHCADRCMRRSRDSSLSR